MKGLLAYLLLLSSMALCVLPNPQEERDLVTQLSLRHGTAGLWPALAGGKRIGGNKPSSKGGFHNPSSVPSEPPAGQRCSGRNYGSRRCCTPSRPCNEGEGDCDGPGDGGMHDGHRGCKGDLQCGSNNCKKFGSYFHEKDDCCERRASHQGGSGNPLNPSKGGSHNPSSVPSEPPAGQRCSGRNYGSRRCCTPSRPCNEGEGDCDGPDDGGMHDGHRGCKGDLQCGSNNCKKFGTYFHEKDDCCERRASPTTAAPSGWGAWSGWRECTRECGGGTKSRIRYCHGPTCTHKLQHQDRPCNTHPCHHHWG